MLLLLSLAPLVVLATGVVASRTGDGNKVVSIPINKLTNPAGSYNIVQKDKRRSRYLLGSGQLYRSLASSVPLNDDLPVVGVYVANISIGNPPVYYQLVVDTGSSFTWVGANKSYVETTTSRKTSSSFNVTYGSGEASAIGTEYTDTVGIAPDLVISQQTIGVAIASNVMGFKHIDGILGIGPRDLTQGVTLPNTSTITPTVTDNLVQQGKIEQNVVGVYFEPSNSTSNVNLNGQLTFGGTNSTKYIGNITYHNLTKTAPASFYFGVNASLLYGKETILNATAGIVDTGTTFIGLNTEAYERYITATGAVYDKATQLLRIPSANYSNLQSLYFTVDGRSYELIPNAQIIPRTFNTIFGGDSSHVYLAVLDLGTTTGVGLGLDFIIGMVFLQRYYSVYDLASSRVGFAETSFTHATDIN